MQFFDLYMIWAVVEFLNFVSIPALITLIVVRQISIRQFRIETESSRDLSSIGKIGENLANGLLSPFTIAYVIFCSLGLILVSISSVFMVDYWIHNSLAVYEIPEFVYPVIPLFTIPIATIVYVRFTLNGQAWLKAIGIARRGRACSFEDSVIRQDIQNLIAMIDEGSPHESSQAIVTLDHLLISKFRIGILSRHILSETDTELLNRFHEGRETEQSHLTIAGILLIISAMFLGFAIFGPFLFHTITAKLGPYLGAYALFCYSAIFHIIDGI